MTFPMQMCHKDFVAKRGLVRLLYYGQKLGHQWLWMVMDRRRVLERPREPQEEIRSLGWFESIQQAWTEYRRTVALATNLPFSNPVVIIGHGVFVGINCHYASFLLGHESYCMLYVHESFFTGSIVEVFSHRSAAPFFLYKCRRLYAGKQGMQHASSIIEFVSDFQKMLLFTKLSDGDDEGEDIEQSSPQPQANINWRDFQVAAFQKRFCN